MITGLRFYKGADNTGLHTADLWDSNGNLLATATFSAETGNGWQQVSFSAPVTIQAGVIYVASYHTNGFYSADAGYFASPVTNGARKRRSPVRGWPCERTTCPAHVQTWRPP